MGIGDKLESLLKIRKTNVNKLSIATGVNAGTIYSIIRRNNTKVDLDDLQRICDELGVTIDYFSTDPTPPNEKKPVQDINLDELEFALFGEIRDLDDEDKEELLRDARRMKELKELRNKQRDNK